METIGFPLKGKGNLVCKLKKSFYDLEKAPYQMFNTCAQSQSYCKSQEHSCLYMKRIRSGSLFVITILYVDDMLNVGKNTYDIVLLRKILSKKTTRKDLGEAKKHIGFVNKSLKIIQMFTSFCGVSYEEGVFI